MASFMLKAYSKLHTPILALILGIFAAIWIFNGPSCPLFIAISFFVGTYIVLFIRLSHVEFTVSPLPVLPTTNWFFFTANGKDFLESRQTVLETLEKQFPAEITHVCICRMMPLIRQPEKNTLSYSDSSTMLSFKHRFSVGHVIEMVKLGDCDMELGEWKDSLVSMVEKWFLAGHLI